MTGNSPVLDHALCDELRSLLNVAIAIIAGAAIDEACDHNRKDNADRIKQAQDLASLGRHITHLAESSAIVSALR
jgi:hypothetical protein